MILSRLEDFRSLWVVDSEYATDENSLPIVRCFAGMELRTGKTLTLWADEVGRLSHNPFTHHGPALIFAWSAEAELLSFQEFWRQPVHVYDLMVAFRMYINGRKLPDSIFPLKAIAQKDGRMRWRREGVEFPSLLKALRYFKRPRMNESEKERWRELAMRPGSFYTVDEKQALLQYCLHDVRETAVLVPYLLHRVPFRSVLLRGYFKAALTWATRNGLPIDMQAWLLFQQHGGTLPVSVVDLRITRPFPSICW